MCDEFKWHISCQVARLDIFREEAFSCLWPYGGLFLPEKTKKKKRVSKIKLDGKISSQLWDKKSVKKFENMRNEIENMRWVKIVKYKMYNYDKKVKILLIISILSHEYDFLSHNYTFLFHNSAFLSHNYSFPAHNYDFHLRIHFLLLQSFTLLHNFDIYLMIMTF